MIPSSCQYIKIIKHLFVAIVLLLIACIREDPNEMKAKAQIQLIFDKMKNEAKWNPDINEMLWGYYFIDNDKSKLEKLSTELKNMGYSFVEIYIDEDNKYWLHVEKIEKHTVDSLYMRNKELKEFATKHEIEDYDGWDVGQTGK